MLNEPDSSEWRRHVIDLQLNPETYPSRTSSSFALMLCANPHGFDSETNNGAYTFYDEEIELFCSRKSFFRIRQGLHTQGHLGMKSIKRNVCIKMLFAHVFTFPWLTKHLALYVYIMKFDLSYVHLYIRDWHELTILHQITVYIAVDWEQTLVGTCWLVAIPSVLPERYYKLQCLKSNCFDQSTSPIIQSAILYSDA